MRRARVLSGGAAALACGAILGCGSGSPGGSTGNTVKIGVLLQTGGDGSDELLAAREINAAGGLTIGGVSYMIDVIRSQMGETPATGAAAVDDMVSQGVVAAVGPRWSSVALGTAPGYTDGADAAAINAGMVLVSGSATAAPITNLVDNDLIWRTVPSDNLQGSLAANTAFTGLAAQTAAILYRNDAWGQGLASTFSSVFQGAGGQVLSSTPYDPTLDLNTYGFPELDTVFAGAPAVVYLLAFDEIAQIGNRIVQGDYMQAYAGALPAFLAADGAFTDTILTNTPGAVLMQLAGTSPAPAADDPNFLKYSSAYSAAGLGTPSNNGPNLYDAMYVIALAMQAANSIQASDFKSQLGPISRDDGGDTTINVGEWATAKAALLSGAGIDYQGASGPIDFTPQGDPGKGHFVLWSVVSDGSGGYAFDRSKGVEYVINADGSASFQ